MAGEREAAFDDIISINHSSTNGRFEVRVVRKWGVLDYSRPGVFGSMEMILMDKHSYKIQTTIPNDVLSVFDEQVQEDVVGVVSIVQHDKNFYSDGRVTRFVSFRLNDQSSVLVEGVERVTKILVNPNVAEVINFGNGSPNYGRLIRANRRLRLSHNLDFINDHPVKSIAELNTDPQLGVFIVNARMVDLLWFPMCKCGEVFEDYIGGFHCTKCNLVQFKVVPKVKLIVELEDETGCAHIKAFDHLMADLAVVDPHAQVIIADDFYKSFHSIMGKSIMWIVKKTAHAPEFVGCSFELIRVTQPKVFEKTLLSGKKGKKTINCLPFTTTTSDMVDQYFYAAFPLLSQYDPGSSSGLKRRRI
ncbi:hypothetical protein TSUD_180960 [Trifolium subterraneum]|uniref:Replication factor A C-terminal domain-containing protein n=1 Tax=Trifolium subterraneum TaxID=3900 RepID=A0A2Z6P5D6_TRISU|nr:hypothetical protein TSUD_180960 [Trifolium subterraneum]